MVRSYVANERRLSGKKSIKGVLSGKNEEVDPKIGGLVVCRGT